MEPTVLKMAMAALVHDIGKFIDRDCLQLTREDIDESEKQLYLPYSSGRYSHMHALYTALFFKFFRNDLPLELQQDFWGEGDSLVNLAAGHHKPSTPMQWVIAVADRVSSGWDRDTFDQQIQAAAPWKEYKRTRQLPLFEQLALVPENERKEEVAGRKRYRLAAVSPESIFPVAGDSAVPSDNQAASEEYRQLAESFTAGLKTLENRDNIELWFEHFDSLLMLHTASLPAARAGNIVPDVSLYDHSRATAALATAIYQYHAHHNTLTSEAVTSYHDPKLLMVQGSFQGIQSFIFGQGGDSQRYRSKLLRGRSFSVTLMTELAVDMLCRRMGLPFSSVVLNAAGRFILVAPNIDPAIKAIQAVRQEMNEWLVGKTFGETRILLTACPLTCNDLVSGRFPSLWELLTRQAEEEKYTGFDLSKYTGVVSDYLDTFHNLPGRPAICPLCGKRAALADAGSFIGKERSACAICRDHIFLGTGLSKRERVIIRKVERENSKAENGLFEPLFGVYQVVFSAEDSTPDKPSAQILRSWQVKSPGEGISATPRVTAKFFNGYIPKYSKEDLSGKNAITVADDEGDRLPDIGDPMTLNHLAACAVSQSEGRLRGTEALGVLKADVDFLGALMSCGLAERRQTLSRAAALSRQLNWFFTIHLPHRLASSDNYRTTYTVFAGGDDLFLIGPWNRMLEFSADIHEDFQRYVCGNEHITFSAGITLHKSHTPISKLAESSEAALERSKSEGRNRLTVFDETVTWDDFIHLIQIRRQMEEWLEADRMSRVFFYRLNDFIAMAGQEQRLRQRQEISLAEMSCTKWRALLTYAAERNVGKSFKGDERRRIVSEVTSQLAAWMSQYGSSLRIPLWTILYNRR